MREICLILLAWRPGKIQEFLIFVLSIRHYDGKKKMKISKASKQHYE